MSADTGLHMKKNVL